MKRVVTFGELLLSLSATGNRRLVQADEFVARYTGAEANAAVSLAQFGVEANVVSKVPEHEIGQACVNALRRFGVNTDHVVRGGDRLGLLYMEAGASQRPTKVIYDRQPSSFRQLRPDDLDWDAVLAGKDWFHFSGTAPAAGGAVVEVLSAGLATARRLGLTVSCDCNYRSKLWSMEEAGRVLAPLLDRVNVLICGKDDPERIFGVQSERPDLTGQDRNEHMAELTRRRFNLDGVAMTFREAPSASINRWSALLCHRDGLCRSRQYEIRVVDRVGGGDAFAAGLIFGLLSGFEPRRTIDFAAAAGCLKHSIPGDFNLVSREEVEHLLAGNDSGRVQR
ncbi:MAG: sugar kinase [Pirellulales bacterium]|nr:sugar kinase [Pirellulales bacterium]